MSVLTEILTKNSKAFFLYGLLMTILGTNTINAFSNRSTSTDYIFIENNHSNHKVKTNWKFDLLNPLIYRPSYEEQLYSRSSNSPQADKSTVKENKGVLEKDSIPIQETRIVTAEIDALLLNATFSPGGYDFFVDLAQNFSPPEAASNYTILVKEYQGRGNLIVIAVEVNDQQLVFRRFRPTYDAIHELSVGVANYLTEYLAKGSHLSGLDADGNFIDVQQTNTTRQIRTPFDVY